MNKFLKYVGIFSFLLLMAVRAQAAAQYTVMELGDFTPTAINNRGEVVGVLATASLQPHAVICSNGVLKDLGTLGGTDSFANDINDNGEVVGYSTMLDGSSHAFLYDGTMRDLGTFGGINSAANGINNSGQIAANYETASGGNYAILYDHGAVVELGTLGGMLESFAKKINSMGDIILDSQSPDAAWHASAFTKGEIFDLHIVGKDSLVADVNDAMQIAGTSLDDSGHPKSFLYANGDISYIVCPDEGTVVTGINNRGDVVGNGLTTYGGFIYSNGEMMNLNELIDPGLGITLTGAYGINDNGQIVACGLDKDLDYTAFLLTPIPEPSEVVLFGSLLAGVIFIYKR